MSKSITEQLEELEKKNAITSGASWMKWPTIGTSIQGVLVSRRVAVSPTGHEQIIYVMKTPDGIFNLGWNSNYPIHRDFTGAVVGQVAKVTYSSDKKHPQVGFSPIKIFTVVTAPSIIDESARKFLESSGLTLGAPLDSEAPAPAAAVAADPLAEEFKALPTSIPTIAEEESDKE